MTLYKTHIDQQHIVAQIKLLQLAVDGMTATFPAITAHAAGGQANAVQLSAGINRVATVATIADSVKLPLATVGARVVVINAAANSLNVFPSTGQNINALANDGAYALAGGKTAEFFCSIAGTWTTILSA